MTPVNDEEPAVLASRAISAQRNRYIAQFMKSVVSSSAIKYEIHKKLLFILEDLTDYDIKILSSIHERGYQVTFSDNYPDRFFNNDFDGMSDDDELDMEETRELWPLQIEIMKRNGLLEDCHPEHRKDFFPSFSDNRDSLIQTKVYEISRLGKLFLSTVIDEKN